MAGKYGSASFSNLFLDGYNILSAKVKGFSSKQSVVLEKSDGLGDSWDEHTPTGARVAAVKQEQAFFDTTTSAIHDALKAATATTRILCWTPADNTIGSIFCACQGVIQIGYDVLAQLNQLVKANAEYAVSGALEEGAIINASAAKTVDWNTKTDGSAVDYAADPTQRVIPITSATKANPCVVTTTVPHGLAAGSKVLISGNSLSGPAINSDLAVTVISTTTFSVAVNTTASTGAGTGGSLVLSNSVLGAVGYQVVSALTGFTGFVGKLRDSSDDITYADLITFANVTTAQIAERATVTGVIDRYMSFDGNVTGSGSINVLCGIHRNDV